MCAWFTVRTYCQRKDRSPVLGGGSLPQLLLYAWGAKPGLLFVLCALEGATVHGFKQCYMQRRTLETHLQAVWPFTHSLAVILGCAATSSSNFQQCVCKCCSFQTGQDSHTP